MVVVTGLVLRSGKGSNLTAAEFDENLTILKEAIEGLSTAEPDQITDIAIVNGHLIVSVGGEAFDAGPVPTIPLRYRGVFAAVDYVPGNIINAPGGIYLVNVPHTGALPFNSAAVSGGTPLYTLLVPTIFAIALHWPTQPGYGLEAGDMMLGYAAETVFHLKAGLTGSVGKIRVNPAATLDFDILKNATVIGSVSISTLGVFTFTFAADVNFAIGDALYCAPPDAIDTDARGLLVTFKASEGAA